MDDFNSDHVEITDNLWTTTTNNETVDEGTRQSTPTRGGDSFEACKPNLRPRLGRESSKRTVLRRSTTTGIDGAALPSAFYCPLTLSVMRVPVIDREGNSYEKEAIEEWLRQNYTSPITRNPLRFRDLSPNRSLKDAIHERMGPDWDISVSLRSLLSTTDNDDIDSESTANEHRRSPPSRSGSFGHMMVDEPRRIVASFLDEISGTIGKNIRLNASGICAFSYEQFTVVIEVPASVRSFFIYTEMLDLTNDPSTELMNKMLHLNYLQQETRGGCLSVDPNSTKAIFSYTDRVDEINANDFRNILENFIDSAMKLSSTLNDGIDGGKTKE